MEEGYPFSGTGNLHRFTQGLISIWIENNTIIVYDNDAEGVAKMQATKRLSLPPNMRVVQLPSLDVFLDFKTIGPTGIGRADINGKAAAIECYLDLERSELPEPMVRWTTFNRELDVYHGELQHKTQYMKDFLQLRAPSRATTRRKLNRSLTIWCRSAWQSPNRTYATHLTRAPFDYLLWSETQMDETLLPNPVPSISSKMPTQDSISLRTARFTNSVPQLSAS